MTRSLDMGDSSRMTLPVVTEISQRLQPVERDSFLEPADRDAKAPAWPWPRRRPSDA